MITRQPITAERLAEIKARARDATACAEWTEAEAADMLYLMDLDGCISSELEPGMVGFLEEAPRDIPDLVAEVERLQAIAIWAIRYRDGAPLCVRCHKTHIDGSWTPLCPPPAKDWFPL